jgi:Holliday junction resolvase RusA-like endonuclease
MTQRDRWAKRPAVLRYRAFCDEVRAAGVELYPCGLHITFILPMPKSWSKRKRADMDGQPHQQRPDADNLCKAIFDAVYDEDCGIWDFRVTKLWGEEGAIIIDSL